MPFGREDEYRGPRLVSENLRWFVDETHPIPTNDRDVSSFVSFCKTHSDLSFYDDWDGGSSPYSGGCRAHVAGRRPAIESEVSKWLDYLEKNKNELRKTKKEQKNKRLVN